MSVNFNTVSANYDVSKTTVGTSKQNSSIASSKVDSFEKNSSFKKSVMNENVMKRYGIFHGNVNEFLGSLNNKAIELKEKKEGFAIFGNLNVEGTIGDNPIELTYNNKEFKGNYNGIDFDLKCSSKSVFGNITEKGKIYGTIGNEPFELDLKNSPIPKDENVQDIISTYLLLNGSVAKTKDGQMDGVKYAKWNKKEQMVSAYICLSPFINL